MKTIYKYSLNLGLTKLEMPKGSEVLDFKIQHKTLVLWALVDTSKPLVERQFTIVGTGHDASHVNWFDYYGTVLDDDFVWHLFEVV